MKGFDFYQLVGVIAPGAILLVGLSLIWPQLRGVLLLSDMSVGDAAIFAILAYAAGQIIQAVGNVIGRLCWWICGKPTDWVRTGTGEFLADSQIALLEGRLATVLGLKGLPQIKKMSKKEWSGVTRQIYSAVAGHSRAGRIDVFNANYGLNRGIAAGLFVLSGLALIPCVNNWHYALVTLGVACVAVYRMRRFDKRYASELLVEFLNITDDGQ